MLTQLQNSDNPEKKLFACCLLAYLCPLAKLSAIIDQVIAYLAICSNDFSLRLGAHTLITCINRFYQAQMLTETRQASRVLLAFPHCSVLVLEHLVAKYYLALLDGQENKAHRIKDSLQETGYAQILSLTNENGK